MSSSGAPGKRIVSLDQFRGYTILGMFLVNFVGGFSACNYVLRHHNTFCSYADTIMPQFLFAVGFAFRLTFGRRVRAQGAAAAYARVVRRLLGLVLVALVVYSVSPVAHSWDELTEMGIWGAIRVPLKRDWFQTLMHIAVTSLWVVPVIRARARVRIAFMVASAGLHVYLSHVFYFHWVNGQPGGVNAIDGGPLGFLTWTIPMIIGTLACDAVADAEGHPRLTPLVVSAVALMGLGYLFSCGSTLYDVPPDQVTARASEKLAANPVIPSAEQWRAAGTRRDAGHWTALLAAPPFVPSPHLEGDIGTSHRLRKWNYWMMSQRAGTISYLTFAAGFSLAVYVLFYLVCDIYGRQLGLFRTFGMNALAAYILHMMVASAVKPFMPKDVPGWYMWAGCGLFMLITYVIVRSLEKQNIFIKL
jgi:predicted acyltransferase